MRVARAATHDPAIPLAKFIRAAWGVLEPAMPLQDNWHIETLANHLQAATEGWVRQGEMPDAANALQNLLINIPPGTAKSRIVSVLWPAWVWIRWPWFRWTFLSANPRVALRDAMYCQDLLESDWYRKTFSIGWELRKDANATSRFYNTAGGCRQSFGIMSRITGDRADALVVDDPHDAEEVESDVRRVAVLNRWDSAIGNRVNDLRRSLRVGIMQRLHEEDWSGHVLSQGGWAHVNLPMEFEVKKACSCRDCTRNATARGPYDERTEEGELLFPTRFPKSVLDTERARLGERRYAGQMQQRPAPSEGLMFPVARFVYVDVVPTGAVYLRYWDKAGTEGGGAYTAGVKVATHEGLVYIADVVRGQWGSDDRNRTMRNTAEADGTGVPIWVEREPGSGGKESAEISIKLLHGYDAHEEPVTGDKATRAKPLAAQAQAGNVRIVRGDWNKAFTGEAELFPNGKYKDQIDAAGGAYNKLALRPRPKVRPNMAPTGHSRA